MSPPTYNDGGVGMIEDEPTNNSIYQMCTQKYKSRSKLPQLGYGVFILASQFFNVAYHAFLLMKMWLSI
jgi:hypothetical protein